MGVTRALALTALLCVCWVTVVSAQAANTVASVEFDGFDLENVGGVLYTSGNVRATGSFTATSYDYDDNNPNQNALIELNDGTAEGDGLMFDRVELVFHRSQALLMLGGNTNVNVSYLQVSYQEGEDPSDVQVSYLFDVERGSELEIGQLYIERLPSAVSFDPINGDFGALFGGTGGGSWNIPVAVIGTAPNDNSNDVTTRVYTTDPDGETGNAVIPDEYLPYLCDRRSVAGEVVTCLGCYDGSRSRAEADSYAEVLVDNCGNCHKLAEVTRVSQLTGASCTVSPGRGGGGGSSSGGGGGGSSTAEGGSSVGAAVGGAIGGVVALGLLYWYLKSRGKPMKEQHTSDVSISEMDSMRGSTDSTVSATVTTEGP